MRDLFQIVCCALLLAISSPLLAQTTRTVCASGCDFTTIQDAVDAAVSGDNISIQDAVHTENSITINKDLTICGGTPDNIVQATNNQGTGNVRIFNIESGASVSINDLVLQNGNLQSNLQGGAILNAGNLALVNCTLRNNNAHRGGAIASTGQLGLVDCTLTGNTVSDQGVNRAFGAAIYAGGTCALANSTVSGNTNNTGGAGGGGGIAILTNATFILLHVTIANNSIGGTGVGAGVSVQSGATLSFGNSIIADNTGAADFNNASLIPLLINDTNIIPTCSGTCATFITDDPVLLALADNGGCTLTHDLGAASAAIDAATPYGPGTAVTVDQRGAARSLLEPDIGAVELTASVPPCVTSLLCEGILPVEYLSFEAGPVGEAVRLDWVTAQEVNNEGFEVERSPDGIRWQSLGFVAGAGNRNTVGAYQYWDRSPDHGTNYYRLKQIDFDGQTQYSALRTVVMTAPSLNQMQVFPNPAGAFFTIRFPVPDLTYRLRLINQLGQAVWDDILEADQNPVIYTKDLGLSAGLYWLKITPLGSEYPESQLVRLVISPGN